MEYELREFAKINNIPIIRDESSRLLFEIVKQAQPKKILEIGTAIGYSACLMKEAVPDALITTLELKEEYFNKAKENFKKFGYADIVQILGDAKEYIEKTKEKFDFIFLDGPKAQYVRYLPFLYDILEVGGTLVADNVYYHGLVRKEGEIDRKHRSIVRNLRLFIQQVSENSKFNTIIYDIEDGVSVSKKLAF